MRYFQQETGTIEEHNREETFASFFDRMQQLLRVLMMSSSGEENRCNRTVPCTELVCFDLI